MPMVVFSGRIRRTICGLDELATLGSGATHVMSILDPDFPDPHGAAEKFQARLCLRFHDIIAPEPGLIAPEPHHIEALLAFGRGLGGASHLLVHCHMGVSRSPAAMAALLAQANPQADERALISHIADLRPQAWPNLLMVALADEQLDRGGRLVAALKPLYERQIRSNPAIADQMIRYGRAAEVELAMS
jgi:predicted protein tyrosine phosphatase